MVARNIYQDTLVCGINSLDSYCFKLFGINRVWSTNHYFHYFTWTFLMDIHGVCFPQIPVPQWGSLPTEQHMGLRLPFPISRDSSRFSSGIIQTCIPTNSWTLPVKWLRRSNIYFSIPYPLVSTNGRRNAHRVYHLRLRTLRIPSCIIQVRLLQRNEELPHETPLRRWQSGFRSLIQDLGSGF